MEQTDTIELETAIAGLESSAANFGARLIPDAKVRVAYNQQAKNLSKEILDQVENGKITAAQGADRASKMRNVLMDAMRGKTSEIARAYAFNQKTQGKSLLYLEQKYALQFYTKPFDKLNASQQNKVWKEVVFSSGRPKTKVNNLAKTMGQVGRSFIAVTIAVSVYNIATAEDQLLATAKEGAVIGGGLLGSVAGGAAAGLACGPGAPVCVGIGIFVGGVMFAVGAEITFDSFWD